MQFSPLVIEEYNALKGEKTKRRLWVQYAAIILPVAMSHFTCSRICECVYFVWHFSVGALARVPCYLLDVSYSRRTSWRGVLRSFRRRLKLRGRSSNYHRQSPPPSTQARPPSR
ncbi:unnamed protein product [Nezara viridula]|uniref:Uncharacterized protein n=1 Tax=Nezara viridula TaxID=85310 RepID=A0A9P0MSG2_NEZVI|nr:unnamed protein product [Nezara viridula]